MCASIGVDPLASGKGFWSNMLEIGDFYYELAVQIVEVFKLKISFNFILSVSYLVRDLKGSYKGL